MKEAEPMPRNAANAISTNGRRARQKAIRLRSIGQGPSAGSLGPPLVVHEDRAAPDDHLARPDAVADLYAAVLFHPDRHLSAPEQHRLLLDPHGRDVALADHGLDRH